LPRSQAPRGEAHVEVRRQASATRNFAIVVPRRQATAWRGRTARSAIHHRWRALFPNDDEAVRTRCRTVCHSANRVDPSIAASPSINEVCQYTSHGSLRTYSPAPRCQCHEFAAPQFPNTITSAVTHYLSLVWRQAAPSASKRCTRSRRRRKYTRSFTWTALSTGTTARTS
jgi:hypothetical protein